MKVAMGLGAAAAALATAQTGAEASKSQALASVMAELKTNAQRKSFRELIDCIDGFKTKLEGEHEAAAKTYQEFTDYCHDEARSKGFAIENSSDEIESASAKIESRKAKIVAADGVLSEGSAKLAEMGGELAEAKKVRAGEAKTFAAAESELVSAVDMLGRAASVLKRELSFVQGGNVNVPPQATKKVAGLLQGLSAILDAAWITSAQRAELTAFMQNGSEQPQAAEYGYESKSGGIVSTIEDMQDKAAGELQDLRKAEMKSKFDFQLLEQSLTDAIANTKETIADASATKTRAAEEKGAAEGSKKSSETTKAADESALAQLQQECQER